MQKASSRVSSQVKSCRNAVFLVSDHHSITIAHFAFSDRSPIALRGPTQTLKIIGTLGCANLCSTNPLDKRHPRVFAIVIAIAASIAQSGALRFL